MSSILNCLAAAFIGLFCGMYFYTTGVARSWLVMTSTIWFAAAVLATLVAAGVLVVLSRGIPYRKSVATAVTALSLLTVVVLGSPQPAVDPREGGGVSDAFCVEAQHTDDLLCFWNEDSYKVAGFDEELGRFDKLKRAIGYRENDGDYIYAEPGIKPEVYASKNDGREFIEFNSFDYLDHSWRQALGLAWSYFNVPNCSQSEALLDQHSVLTSLAANYIYGDISFEDARIADNHLDREWKKEIEKLSSEPDRAFESLVNMGKRYIAMCSAGETGKEPENNG